MRDPYIRPLVSTFIDYIEEEVENKPLPRRSGVVNPTLDLELVREDLLFLTRS